MGANTAQVAALGLKCPSCGMGLGDMPASFRGSVRCDACGFSIHSDGDYWDACVDKSFPRDFARQWVLWEEGMLGDPTLVYGEDPAYYFREFLAHTSLRPEQLSSKTVLEVGFGHGRLLHQIQEWCPSARGVDLAKPLQSAHLRPGSTIFGNLLSIPFMPGQFDLVVCRGVVHCTPDPEASFGCVAAQVADNGLLYLAGLYEPGTRGMLILRKVLPRSWSYPEPILLGLTSVCSGLRAVLEGIRSRNMHPGFLRTYYDHHKLEIFDVMAPRWTFILGADTIIPWFTSRGFEARQVGPGSYVGIKAAAPLEA